MASTEGLKQLTGYHSAFATGPAFNQTRLHSSNLPAPPRHWGALKTHIHRAGFESAAQKEYGDLQAKGTFDAVPATQAEGQFVIPLMWVFTYKLDADGYLLKYKARLVVRGDLQRYKNEDTYAATLAARVFRLAMAIAAYFDLEIYQFDAVNAFTNAFLDEVVYVKYPDGFERPGSVLRVIRALYGLVRSPLLWFKDFTAALISMGLTQVDEVPCLFVNSSLIVFFYVDDICVLYHPSQQGAYNQFRTQLLGRYKMREIGELKWFLGIRVLRNRTDRKLWLCQDSYISKITSIYGLQDSPAPRTPLGVEPLVPSQATATTHQIQEYQRRVGHLTYAATITRADISSSTRKLAEFLQNPSPAHKEAADRVIRYLNGTRNLAIEYDARADRTPVFRVSSDAAFADDPQYRWSSEGREFSLFGGLIDWSANKQRTTTKSSTEAELLAISHLIDSLYWWQRLFNHIQLDLDEDYVVNCDNIQTIRLMLMDSPKLVTKLKHMDIHSHWVRQEVARGRFKLEWVSTNDMPADGFTKSLPRQQHEKFIKMLNLVDITSLLAIQD